jgi:hypothetical protein
MLTKVVPTVPFRDPLTQVMLTTDTQNTMRIRRAKDRQGHPLRRDATRGVASQKEEKSPEPEQRPSVHLPLADYLIWAWHDDQRHEADREEEWHSRLFNFTRLAKARPDLRQLNGGKAMKQIKAVISRWARERAPSEPDPWWTYFKVKADDAETQVVDIWEKVRVVPGEDPLEWALQEAKAQPAELSANKQSRKPAGRTAGALTDDRGPMRDGAGREIVERLRAALAGFARPVRISVAGSRLVGVGCSLPLRGAPAVPLDAPGA